MSGLFSLESWSTVWTHRESFLLGLGNTLQTAVCALALAFIIGVLIIGVLRNGLNLLSVSPFLQAVVIGIVIALAVAAESFKKAS